MATDPATAPKEVLQAYKFQPRLEKRFAQFKSIHRGAPLLFKKISRVEANQNDHPVEHYRDELNETHKAVLKLPDIDRNTFWNS